VAYRLFTTYYQQRKASRRDELDLCLKLNQAAFDDTTVLAENCDRLPGIWGRWFTCDHRQMYADLLALAADSKPDDIGVISNTDILFTSLALTTIEFHIQPDEVYALTRWDITPRGHKLFEAAHSQDAWVFRGPPKENIGGNYPFGHPGCDNRFAHELDAAGYKVLNPSRDIHTYHLHLSGHRPGNTPENRVPGPYLFVSPHKIGGEPTYAHPAKVSKRASQVQR